MKPIDTDIREALDACRAGSDDLQMPELAALRDKLAEDILLRDEYERSQHFDAKLGETFREDIPVPSDLEAKLLASLASQTKPALAPRTWFWRSSLVVTTVLAASILIIAAFNARHQPQPLDRGEFIQKASLYVAQVAKNPHWQNEATAPERYPTSRCVSLPVHGWQAVSTSFDANAVVYDVTPRNGPSAMLLVIRPTIEICQLREGPPLHPHATTGGQSVAAWQERDLVFVLVVRGPGHEDQYRRMTQPTGQLALFLKKLKPTAQKPCLISKV